MGPRRALSGPAHARRQALATFRPKVGLAVDDGLDAMGGGLHFQRPVLRAGRERIAHRKRSLLRVVHQDRPCRCGFDGCAYLAETRDCAIRVVKESLSPQAELVEDLMARGAHILRPSVRLAPLQEENPGSRHRWLRRSRASCTARG